MTRSKAKLIALAIVVVLLAIVIAQNTEPVETRLLFVTVTMPRAVLLMVIALLGYAAGLISVRRARGATPPPK